MMIRLIIFLVMSLQIFCFGQDSTDIKRDLFYFEEVDYIFVEAETRYITVDTASLYPNPSNGIFNISSGNETDNAIVLVSNMAGGIVHESTWGVLESELNLDLQTLSAGIYTYSIQTETHQKTFKLVIY